MRHVLGATRYIALIAVLGTSLPRSLAIHDLDDLKRPLPPLVGL